MAAGKAIPLEPLRFERIFLEKVWGGRALERAPGIPLPGTSPIGETWELSDREDRNSVVADGPFRGRSLRELMGERKPEILGRARTARDGSFPLLVKFLDAAEALSVQVHPHSGVPDLPADAAAKTECWYVLAARPGSVVYLGPRRGSDASEFQALGVDSRVLGLLEVHPVEAGSFIFVPGGTVHAIGMGVTLVEIQETSDTTYRIWDWDRASDRPLHREQAARAIRFDRAPSVPVRAQTRPAPGARSGGLGWAQLVDCPEFKVELLEVDGVADGETHERALVYVALAGRGRIATDAARFDLAPGDTWLVPASVGRHRVESAGLLRILRVVTK
jgi:mannose-6-phosphate isomerase